MSLRARPRERTVSVILDAASRVFAERGYHGTLMEDVAHSVGCAPATLYGYFKGKGELFGRLVARREGRKGEKIGVRRHRRRAPEGGRGDGPSKDVADPPKPQVSGQAGVFGYSDSFDGVPRWCLRNGLGLRDRNS